MQTEAKNTSKAGLAQGAQVRRICTLVLGMHRSGTSALVRTLNLMGAALPSQIVAPSEGNPLGHWEPEALVALNDKLLYEATDGWDEWQAFDLNALAADRQDYYRREISRLLTEEYASAPLFVLKDPRLCRLAPLYFDVFSELNIDVRIAVAYRDPVAVAASLHARNGYDKTTGLLFWLRHVLDAERSSRDYRRTFIEYDKLLDDWRGCLSKLQVDLGLPLNDLDAATAERIDGFLRPDMRSFKKAQTGANTFSPAAQWADKTYAQLARLSENPYSDEACLTLDDVAADFDPYAADFAPHARSLRKDSMKAYEELARSQRQETVWRKEARAQEREAKAQETLRYKAENIARYEMGEKQKKIHEIGALEEEIQRVHDHFIRSTSWRITAPLRALGRMKTGAPSLRSVRALKHAIQYHGVRGGLRKVFVVARKKGPVGLFNQLGHSLAQHNTITEPAAGRHEYLELMDARNEFLASLGERPAPALAPDPGVLIISDTTLPQCIHYRIRNKIEMLNAHDVQAEFCNPHDIAQTLSKMQYYRVVLFYRMQMDDLFMLYHDEARRLGASIAYDLDDPMFDRAVLGGNENLKMIEPHHRIYQLREANRIRQAMDACDYLIASTPGLAELMGSATGGKQAYVWRNVASQETLALGSETQQRITRGASGRIRLGYFSGSLAHEADFDIAAPALADLMACRDDVDLLLFGHVCSRKILEPFSKRILIQNFSDYPHYLEAVAGCDAILVPLLDNPFNRCKSIVRYIDAAVVETPVLASRVGDYDALITHGQTGWLAGPDQWRAALEEVCTLGDKRGGVGAYARRFIEEKFSTLTNMPVLDEPARKQIFGN